MFKKKLDAKTIATMGLLMALQLVLTRFVSIETPIVRIGFDFLPIAIMGMLFGPWLSGVAVAMTDIIGISLFARTAPFFPGFTLSAFLTAAVYGLFLYKKPKTLLRVALAVIMVTIVINLGLNTLWLSMIYDKAMIVIFPARILQNLIMTPIQIALLYFVVRSNILTKTIGIDSTK